MITTNIEKWLEIEPYSLARKEKRRWLSENLIHLTKMHKTRCKHYAQLLDVHKAISIKEEGLEGVPYIPARLFKEFELYSVDQSEIFKTMTSW